MSPGLSFRLDENAAESAHFGIKVGEVCGIDPASLPDAGAIADAGRRAGFRLLTLAVGAPVSIAGFVYVGTLDEYRAPVAIVRDLLPSSRHFPIVALEDGGWDRLPALLDAAAPTRFSRDARIDPERVTRRKLAILRERHARGQAYAAFAFATTGACLGFQYSYVDRRAFTLYELVVPAERMKGLVAAELVAHNLEAAIAGGAPLDAVTTLVYADNQPSIQFWARLGLRPTGRGLFHYHHWL